MNNWLFLTMLGVLILFVGLTAFEIDYRVSRKYHNMGRMEYMLMKDHIRIVK